MVTHFQKFIDYFKVHYHEDEKQLILGELVFKELFFSKVSNDRKNYSHVVSLFSHHGFLVMFSKSKYIINLDRIRHFNGEVF